MHVKFEILVVRQEHFRHRKDTTGRMPRWNTLQRSLAKTLLIYATLLQLVQLCQSDCILERVKNSPAASFNHLGFVHPQGFDDRFALLLHLEKLRYQILDAQHGVVHALAAAWEKKKSKLVYVNKGDAFVYRRTW